MLAQAITTIVLLTVMMDGFSLDMGSARVMSLLGCVQGGTHPD